MELLEQPTALQTTDIAAVVQVIATGGGFVAAREMAMQFVREAWLELEMIPAGAARDGLACLAAKAVDRNA